MNQSILSVRVNTEDKKEFEDFCKKTGMNVSTAINMFIKNVLASQCIPFQVKVPKIPKEIEEKLLEAEEELNNHPKYYSAEEVFEGIKKYLDN